MIELKKEDIFTVSDVNKIVKNIVGDLPLLWVEGEVANFTAHTSGHIYFSLKDSNSTLRCAFFRQYNIDSRHPVKDGDKVLCQGKLDVYEKTGTYQLLVRQLLPAGIGELQIKFLALKDKLSKEGLFDASFKKPLPEYPESIGIITSPTGAAFQDIKNILTRRYPCNIYLYPAAVQGEKAVPELNSGLRYFNEDFPVDLIIIGRGGGSQEDLFCFNDEELARTIFASNIPVISAVGHEIDFTISDFVADLRAPTPSAAAELAVPDKQDLMIQLRNYQKQLQVKSRQHILNLRNFIHSSEKTLYQKHPRTILFKYQQEFDDAVAEFSEKMAIIGDMRAEHDSLREKLIYAGNRKSAELVHRQEMRIEKLQNLMNNSVEKKTEEMREKLKDKYHILLSLSPYEALKRGYGIIRKENRIINSVTKIATSDLLEILLQDGNCQCRVEKIEKKP